MYKYLVLLLLLFISHLLQAQPGFGLVNKVRNKVAGRIDQKTDKAIDKVLDELEGKPQATAPGQSPLGETTAGNKALQSYARYDFIPGEKVIYSNDFATDIAGEMPAGWNTNGTGAVVTIDGVPGQWVQLYQNSTYLTDNKEVFTENFTLEFDLVLRRTNPKAAFPQFAFGVLSSGDAGTTDNELLKNYAGVFATELKVQPSDNGGSHLHLETFEAGKRYLNTDVKKFGQLESSFNNVIHVAMQVQKERLRIWFDETKLYDLPKAIIPGTQINQLYFQVKRYGGDDAEVGYAVSRLKIATGLPDTRQRLLDEGVFSTTGIVFDVNAAAIRPESSGVLREIADILQKNPGVSVRITGHTDSEGADAANLELSRKRTEAVKQSLVADYGIDASRMNTDGKGESVPVGDNRTKEGRAQNRRVEFSKQQ